MHDAGGNRAARVIFDPRSAGSDAVAFRIGDEPGKPATIFRYETRIEKEQEEFGSAGRDAVTPFSRIHMVVDDCVLPIIS